MKRYPHIFSKLYYEPLVLTRAKHNEICKFMESRLQDGGGEINIGGREPLSADEEMEWNGYRRVNDAAIITVEGPIGKHLSSMEMMSGGGCDLDNVNAMIDLAIEDPDVERIIFDFRSPGGSVTGIPETGRKIAGIVSKPTIAYTDSECCSGALWLAAQCRTIYATESATIGSIGVWCAYLDVSRQMANQGQSIQEFSAGKYKTMGAYWRPLSDEEAGMIQRNVDKIYGQFKTAVNLHREVADKFMQGQTFDGMDALDAGLIDFLVEDLQQVLDEDQS